MNQEFTTIIVALITSLFGAGGWTFYKAKFEAKKAEQAEIRKDKNIFRDDLQERVIKLESKVDDCEDSREKLMREMISVRESLAEFRTRVSFLETQKAT